ncbi:unnamed protein product, partial [Timema podura]|nr:unnamed protein product [Timema podura]
MRGDADKMQHCPLCAPTCRQCLVVSNDIRKRFVGEGRVVVPDVLVYTIPIFKKGYNGDLEESDLLGPVKKDQSNIVGDTIEATWFKELELSRQRNRKPSLLKVVFRAFYWDFLILGALQMVCDMVLRMSQPLVLGHLLSYFKPGSVVTKQEAYISSAVLALIVGLTAIMYNHIVMRSFNLGMRVRVALSSLIYRKGLCCAVGPLREEDFSTVQQLALPSVGYLPWWLGRHTVGRRIVLGGADFEKGSEPNNMSRSPWEQLAVLMLLLAITVGYKVEGLVLLLHMHVHSLSFLLETTAVRCLNVSVVDYILVSQSLRLSRDILVKTGSGKIINIISSDLARFDIICYYMNSIWVSPFSVLILLYLVWSEAGLAGGLGVLSVVLLLVPTQWSSTFRRQTALRTDVRLGLMNEVITGMKIIKMYAWEKPYSKLIGNARKAEIAELRKMSYMRGMFMALNICSSRTALFVTMTSTVLLGGVLSADKVFVFASYFNTICLNMTTPFVRALAELAEASVSLSRIEVSLSKHN